MNDSKDEVDELVTLERLAELHEAIEPARRRLYAAVASKHADPECVAYGIRALNDGKRDWVPDHAELAQWFSALDQLAKRRSAFDPEPIKQLARFAAARPGFSGAEFPLAWYPARTGDPAAGCAGAHLVNAAAETAAMLLQAGEEPATALRTRADSLAADLRTVLHGWAVHYDGVGYDRTDERYQLARTAGRSPIPMPGMPALAEAIYVLEHAQQAHAAAGRG